MFAYPSNPGPIYRACEKIAVGWVVFLCLAWLYGPFIYDSKAAEPISIKVKNGTVNTQDEKKSDGTIVPGKNVEIGKGTFLPDPHDAKLAKEIVEYRTMIEEWKIKYNGLQNKLDRREETYSQKEERIVDNYEEMLKARDLKIAILESWFNKYGKTLLWCIVSAAAATAVTYGVMQIDWK